MNRISRRSAAEAAEALLEVGRTQPVLHYDVELGLERHHHWLRSEAPMPEWASASLGTGAAAKSLVPVVIKTIVSALLMGGVGVAAWHARGHQPPTAAVEQPAPSAERAPAAVPSAREDAASEAWMARTPIPVPEQGLPSDHSDQPARRAVLDKRSTHWLRGHRERAAARAARAREALPRVAAAEAIPARVEPPPTATTPPSEDVSVERSTGHDVAAVPERKPLSAAHRARPEPRPEAQGPDDLLEMQQVATAEQLLERSPERALALVHQGDQRFARGYFQQERAYIAIMALIRLGRIEEARGRAASFGKQFPALPYGARIRSALEAREAAAPHAGSRDALP